MKYVCVKTTFHDKLYEPGEVYEAVGSELKDNPCWKPVGSEKKGKPSASSDDSSKSEAKSSE